MAVRVSGGPPSPRSLARRATGVSLGVTLGVFAVPWVPITFHDPALRLVLDTVDAFVALLAGYLVLGRVLSHRRRQDACLGVALMLTGCSIVTWALLPRLLQGVDAPELVAGRSVLAAHLVAALVLLLSARAAPSQTVTPAGLALATGCILGLTIVGSALLHPDPALRAVLGGAEFAMILLAAALFIRHAELTHDELLRWLGPALVLLAFARLHHVLVPEPGSSFVYLGDLLRTGCYLLMLTGVLMEIRSFWAGQARLAAAQERGRVARDLHDGLTQELTYLHTQLALVDADPEAASRVRSAAERALAESRQLLGELALDHEDSLASALARTAVHVESRFHLQVDTDLDHGVTAPSRLRDELVRVAREALVNAARHSGSKQVSLVLRRTDGGCLVAVADTGIGFDTDRVRPGSFGIRSMSERAERAGAHLRLESHPGAGTTVQVSWHA